MGFYRATIGLSEGNFEVTDEAQADEKAGKQHLKGKVRERNEKLEQIRTSMGSTGIQVQEMGRERGRGAMEKKIR